MDCDYSFDCWRWDMYFFSIKLVQPIIMPKELNKQKLEHVNISNSFFWINMITWQRLLNAELFCCSYLVRFSFMWQRKLQNNIYSFVSLIYYDLEVLNNATFTYIRFLFSTKIIRFHIRIILYTKLGTYSVLDTKFTFFSDYFLRNLTCRFVLLACNNQVICMVWSFSNKWQNQK